MSEKKSFKKTINPKVKVTITKTREPHEETPEEQNQNFKNFVYYALDMLCTEIDNIRMALDKTTKAHNAILKMACSACPDEEACEKCPIFKALIYNE